MSSEPRFHVPDARIIARAGAHEILGQRHEVMFNDGTAVGLHPINRAGVPQVTLRALATDAGGFLLFDVGALMRALDHDLRICHDRDRVGMVFFAARRAFRTKRDFVLAVRARSLAEVLPLQADELAAAA